jgi:L-ribulose-5-phosphate 3-epimerase
VTGLRYAYGSNGLGDHRLADACALLADEGYDGIALTLDHHHLDPTTADLLDRAAAVRRLLDDHGLSVVVETGGRFVLDPRRKHQPTLVSADGAHRRIEFYRRALDVAAVIGSPVLHLWSGVAPPQHPAGQVWERLLTNLQAAVDDATAVGIPLALEPEPGMVVDTLDAFERVLADLGHPPALQLTLDIGHCRCSEPQAEADCVRRVADRLAHVQVEDMRRGVHEHLPFGDGEVDVAGALAALVEVGYDGLVSVELTRHSHTAHTMVPAAIRFLREAEAAGTGRRPHEGVA